MRHAVSEILIRGRREDVARLAFDLRQVAGSFSQGVGGVYGFLPTVPSDIISQPTLLLFDNRTYYLQSTMDVSYIASPRTIYTAGGDGFLVRRRASSFLAALLGLGSPSPSRSPGPSPCLGP